MAADDEFRKSNIMTEKRWVTAEYDLPNFTVFRKFWINSRVASEQGAGLEERLAVGQELDMRLRNGVGELSSNV